MISSQPRNLSAPQALFIRASKANENNNVFNFKSVSIEQNFEQLYHLYQNRVYQVALRYLKTPADAQEVVQEVFMKLWTERTNIQCGTPIEAWLCTVAKNNTLNRLKRLAIEWKAINYFKNSQQPNSVSAGDKVEEADCSRLLHNALNSLSENQYKVYRLAREENLSYAQIAEQLSISPLTVKTHMARALAQLRQVLPRISN